VFLNDIEVVEQPIPGRTDTSPRSRRCSARDKRDRDLSRVLEAEQKRSGATVVFAPEGDDCPRANCSRTFAESLETEYSPRIGPTSSSRIRFGERPNRRLRIVVGALGGIAVATSLTIARGVPLSDGHARKISVWSTPRIRLDAESHQPLADTFILIRILRPQRFREGVHISLKMTMSLREATFSGVLLCRPVSNIGERRCRTVGLLELVRE